MNPTSASCTELHVVVDGGSELVHQAKKALPAIIDSPEHQVERACAHTRTLPQGVTSTKRSCCGLVSVNLH